MKFESQTREGWQTSFPRLPQMMKREAIMGFGQYSNQGVQRKTKAEMVDAVAKELSAKHEPREVLLSRMVARNTVEYRLTDGTLRIRLHDTDIFSRDPDGNITLDTGGWNTLTTRTRINEALKAHKPGYVVFPGRGQATVQTPSGRRHKFNQRITIGRTGFVQSDIATGDAESYDAMRKDVDRYMAALRERGVPKESMGDPWVFADAKTHKYDAETVRNWLRDPDSGEPYLFQTFIVNAMKYAGCSDSEIGGRIQDIWAGRGDTTLLCRRVRRYIRACLGLTA